MSRELVFTRFERFWHWSQAVLIVALMTTGFEVNGSYALFGYAEAVEYHRILAWLLIGLWVFAIFWHFTTGEWRQYLPTTEKLVAVVKYYTLGIYHPAVQHPFKKSRLSKHNPLQRLAYLFLKLCINPLIWITGLLYMFYNDWSVVGLEGLSLGVVAALHLIGAFMMLFFFIAHVYMIFTAKPLTHYLKSMLTGYEEIEKE
ncbi:MAG: cytochrome b/b6 domain-containing protein [Candidatus Sedimenticola sp. PURPLELP]